jgi:hypothetical protein
LSTQRNTTVMSDRAAFEHEECRDSVLQHHDFKVARTVGGAIACAECGCIEHSALRDYA